MTSFGQAAERLSGVAAQLLGWRPEEFWSATPAELASALRPPEEAATPPDADTIAELRLRFPDDEKR